jgi:hypothetical protein
LRCLYPLRGRLAESDGFVNRLLRRVLVNFIAASHAWKLLLSDEQLELLIGQPAPAQH